MCYIVFQVIGYTAAGESFPVTSNYVLPASSTVQGSYLDIPLMREAKKFEFLLSGSGATYGYVGLSEIEIFADGDDTDDR